MQVAQARQMVPLARAVRLEEHGLALRAAICSWGVDEETARQHDGVNQATGEGLLGLLAAQDITAIGGGGRPVAAAQAEAAGPLRPQVPMKHLLSCYLKHAADAKYAQVLEASPSETRTLMFSAAGPTAGSSFSAPLNVPGVHYSDRQWTEALRWRLGVRATAHGTCKNERMDERACGET